jgi:hypothetical protein
MLRDIGRAAKGIMLAATAERRPGALPPLI